MFFLYLLFFFKTILCIILLTKDRAEASPADISTTMNPTPVNDSVTDVVVAPKSKTVSTDTHIEVRVNFHFLYFFFDGIISFLE